MLHLWKKNVKKLSKSVNYQKVRHHCQYTGKYRGATDSICSELIEEQFELLGENTEKYESFSIPVEKKLKILIKMVMKLLSLYLSK